MKIIPGLTDDKTCNLIENYLDKNYQDIGNIVELGTFLGKVTHTISKFLKNKNHNKKLYTYDNFVWNFNHKKKFPEIKKNVNECFLDLSMENVNSENTVFRKTLIENLDYNEGDIEILVLDAPKNYNELVNIFQKLSKYFIPNKTKIIFLDYFISIKYDTQLFINFIHKYVKYNFYEKELAIVEIEKNISEINFLNKKKTQKKIFQKAEDIENFFCDLFNKIPDDKKKILSILPALCYYENGYYIKSFNYLLRAKCYVQKKYVLIKYMIKRYKFLNLFLLYIYLRGRFY